MLLVPMPGEKETLEVRRFSVTSAKCIVGRLGPTEGLVYRPHFPFLYTRHAIILTSVEQGIPMDILMGLGMALALAKMIVRA